MRVLIVGGTGVISNGITPRLIERGDEVVLFNRGTTAAEFDGDYEVIVGDRDDNDAFERTMQAQEPFDCVIEMIASDLDRVESDIRAFRGRTSQYIFTSTVAAYTKPAAVYPITESAGRSPVEEFAYGYGNAQCERLLESVHGDDFPVTIIRPGSTYFRKFAYTFGAATFWIDRMRKSMPIIVHGDGQAYWALAHRDDVGRAFANAVGNGAAIGEDYHITSEESLTWDGIYRAVAEAAGAPEPELVHIPTDVLAAATPLAEITRLNYQYNNIFDNSKAKRDLGYEYTIPFLEGATAAVRMLDERGEVDSAEDFPWYDEILASWRDAMGGMAGFSG